MQIQVRPKSIKDPREFFDYLKGVSLSEMQYEFDKLVAIEQWVKDQLPIHGGDKVELHGYRVTDTNSGWWAYREALHEGATATVQRVLFSPPKQTWYAEIILDQEWSVSDFGGKLRRYTTENDKRGLFMFSLKFLRRIDVS